VNDSVRKLDQLLTRQLPKELHDLAVEELNKQAEKLRQAIAAAAPVHEGTLRTTVKTVPGKKDTTVRIVAGGHETVRESVSSKPYDYARADEFGTVNMPAQPFFFPTYNRMKRQIKEEMKAKVALNIKKYSA